MATTNTSLPRAWRKSWGSCGAQTRISRKQTLRLPKRAWTSTHAADSQGTESRASRTRTMRFKVSNSGWAAWPDRSRRKTWCFRETPKLPAGYWMRTLESAFVPGGGYWTIHEIHAPETRAANEPWALPYRIFFLPGVSQVALTRPMCRSRWVQILELTYGVPLVPPRLMLSENWRLSGLGFLVGGSSCFLEALVPDLHFPDGTSSFRLLRLAQRRHLPLVSAGLRGLPQPG